MAKLGVNVDLVARLRELRKTTYPDLMEAVRIVEGAGAESIVVHLRQDRRHIQDKDLYDLKEGIKTSLNLEMALTPEMLKIALDVKPEVVTLVPERVDEVTTEGGLEINKGRIQEFIDKLKGGGLKVSFFLNPSLTQIEAASKMKPDFIELCTKAYAEATTEEERNKNFKAIQIAVQALNELKLSPKAGHGLDYGNVKRLVTLGIEEFSIGHSIVLRSLFIGLEAAVKEMLALVRGD